MRKNKTCGIYCIENKKNKKKYIGQSKDIESRWCRHKYELNNGNHDNDYLQKSWNKYGSNSFVFYILEKCDCSELDEKENYYINLYNTINRNCGYNLKTGGQNGNYEVTDYTKQKISNRLKEYYSNPETRKKKSESALNQWSKPEIKAKIMGKNNGRYGTHLSEEAKMKISKANTGRISKYRNLTPVYCFELDRIFECAAVAYKELNIKTSILEVCKGNRKTAGGYHWKFIMENN